MRPVDLQTMKDRLIELADVYGVKPPTEPAIRVWFHTLKEFALEDVAGFLIGWPRLATKMPTPSDVWKYLNERRTDRIEEQVAADKVKFEREARSWQATPVGKQAIAALKHMMAGRPRETIAEKCLRNSKEALSRHESGAFTLPHWALHHHKARVASSMPERQPGDDFEEDLA
jgi:hypothetical protein